jgi:hypothetical protein
MKKLFVILAACFVMASCQFWHETFSSPADCATWYCEQIAEAEKEGDEAKAEERAKDFEEYFDSLDKDEQAEAAAAALAFAMGEGSDLYY